MRAQAAATTTLPRPASGGSSVSASAAVSSTDKASAGDVLLPYPLLHESNYFDHEASGRKHARMLSNRIARDATWIDAVGQHKMNRKFRDGDSKRKRINITREMAKSSQVRHVLDNVGHQLAGLPDNPPSNVALAVGPTVLVPDEDQRWSFEFKDWSEGQVEQELATLQTAVESTYSAPAVVNKEAVLLSPPSGKSDSNPPCTASHIRPNGLFQTEYGKSYTPEMYLVRQVMYARTNSSTQSTASHIRPKCT